MIKIALIDNYDSFTYNIVHYLGILGYSIEVIKNDNLLLMHDALSAYTHIILSPGPGAPANAGLTREVIKAYYKKMPFLGICLGHQCLGEFFGARIIHAKQVMHGKLSVMHHDNNPLFAGLPRHFNVVRYHSLVIDAAALPSCLTAIGWTQTHDNSAIEEIMAIRHQDYPLFGVQYHPEALLTEYGLNVLRNFVISCR